MQHASRLALLSLSALTALTAACGSAPEGGVEACPTVLGAPIVHPQTIAQSETWSAANVHVVQGDTSVMEGVTLTIDPCAQVVFRQNASLTLGRTGRGAPAQLIAEGTAQRPIHFSGENGVRWGEIFVQHPARATLRHAHFTHGGADRFHQHATLSLRGDGLTPAKPVALLDHVTVEDSLGSGVVAERTATFAPGSRDLVITRTGHGGVNPYPLRIHEHAIDALPTGRYTGNQVDEILLDPAGANGTGGLQEDATLRDRGVPYRVGSSSVDRFSIGAGGQNAPRQTTLTIEPGVVMRFAPGTRLAVEHYTGEFAASGVLRAVGTAERPIVMTSAAATPRPGDWGGVWYGGIASPQNRLEHVTLAYTGYDCGCVLSTCSDVPDHDAAVIFSQPPTADFIHRVRFVHGHGHGVFRGWRGAATPDYTADNVFENMGGCAQTLPMLPDGCGARRACR
ncbi:MAG: hypothetical protein U0325_14755 [Polyangiales bacterium]